MTAVIVLMALGAISFQVGLKLPSWIYLLYNKFQNERLLSRLRPTEVDEYILCQGRHDWMPTPHNVDEKGEITYTNVCRVCGYIPSMGLMATQEGLQYIFENKKRIAAEEQMKDDFLKLEMEGIATHFQEEIKEGLDLKKLKVLHLAGQSFRERFILYKSLKTQPKAEIGNE
jgi:hypothetical protein